MLTCTTPLITWFSLLHTVGVATSPGPRGDRTETNSVADAARTGDAHRAHVLIYNLVIGPQ